jgi:hypothetical protein
MLLAPAPRQDLLREVGRLVYPALRLRALAALVVEPIAAVAIYLLLTGFSARQDLGRPAGPPDLDPEYR